MGAENSQGEQAPTTARRNDIESLPESFNEAEREVYESSEQARHVYRDESDDEDSTIGQRKEGYSKSVYYGEFKVISENPKTICREGKGIMFYKRGDAERRIKYFGEWKDDKFDGQGVLDLCGGAKYDGQWSQGKKEGKGSERTENNSTYNGYFRNNKRSGHGRYKDSNGFDYVGMFKRGKRHGKGVLNFTNGDKFDGEFKENIQAEGEYTFASGNVYTGKFDETGVMNDDEASLVFAESGNEYKGPIKGG